MSEKGDSAEAKPSVDVANPAIRKDEETKDQQEDGTTVAQSADVGGLPLPASVVSAATLESFLQNSLWDLQTRSEVEATMESMITEVEFAVTLQEQLKIRTHQSQAEKIIAQQELALAETRAVQEQCHKSRALLADGLVTDLMALSKEIGQLFKIKQKYEAMVGEYDEVVAKLAQAEEDLRAERLAPRAAPAPTPVSVLAQQPVPTQTTPLKKPPPSQQPAQSSPQKQSPKSSPKPPPPAAQPSPTMVALPPPAEPKPTRVTIPPAVSGTEPTTAATPKDDTEESKKSGDGDEDAKAPAVTLESAVSQEEAQASAASTSSAVALVVDDAAADNEPPTLENVDMEILMRIFGFLDAYDILKTAQVNISMYSRVDSLFGMSGGQDNIVGDDAASTTSTLATTPTVASAPLGTTSSSQRTATTSASTAGTSKPAAKAPAPAFANTGPQFGQRLVGGGRGLLSLLQGKAGDGAGDSSVAAGKQRSPRKGGRGRSGSDSTAEKPPLSEAMAHSMAAKLNDSEINAIIAMTERLRTKEKEVSTLNREKEELEGKLNGSEAVKDFLITKVRDMEQIMNKSDETEKKVTQQIASDQEVIAFLDGRVQELENSTRQLTKEKNAALEKLKAAQAQNDKKVAVLSDMLQFERQKLRENEREWKATKKLLVKEVKGCRAQIVALQAERDGFREQNDALRKAVMSTSGGSGSINGSPKR